MSVIDTVEGHEPVGPAGTHSLLVSETVGDQRTGVAAWVGEQLAEGAKVFYKARPDIWDGGDTSWLLSQDGVPDASRALASGQLELVDFVEVIRVTGGTTEGLLRLQSDEVARGLDEGWCRVAMSQESPSRPMASSADIADFAAQEAGYDNLARRWPLTTLCQLTLVQENSAAAWETAALHCGDIVDHQWGAGWAGGRWRVHGELDVNVVQRFGAALHGALRERRQGPGEPTLHIDASEIEFFDIGSAQSLMLAAHAVARRQQIVLHAASDLVRNVIKAVGQPRALRFAEDLWSGQ